MIRKKKGTNLESNFNLLLKELVTLKDYLYMYKKKIFFLKNKIYVGKKGKKNTKNFKQRFCRNYVTKTQDQYFLFEYLQNNVATKNINCFIKKKNFKEIKTIENILTCKNQKKIVIDILNYIFFSNAKLQDKKHGVREKESYSTNL